MATICQTAFSIALYKNAKKYISIMFSLKFIPNGPINNNLA